MKSKVTFLNHASVLIETEGNYILTDPWYDRVSFGSWFPTPPPVYNPVYLITLAKNNPNFFIVISHGHDDHLDDKFLNLMPREVKCLIPKYNSIGLKNRLKSCGLNNIIEFDEVGLSLNGMVFKSYIFEEISLDDAFITIATKNFIIAHANDNWQKIPTHQMLKIKYDFMKYKKTNTLVMSQTNLADGFPQIYENYTNRQKKTLTKKRQDKMILRGVMNALEIGSNAFMSYAGMALPFLKDKAETTSPGYHGSYRSIKYIKDLLMENGIKDIVLDMTPGDSYDFDKVEKLFGKDLDQEMIKETSIEFYKNYGLVSQCDTYDPDHTRVSVENKRKYLQNFLFNFKKFVKTKSQKTKDYQNDVFKINFSFEDSEVRGICEMSMSPTTTVEFKYENKILEKILTGTINWENSYIGYQSSVAVTPEANIGSLIRWLSMFGYVYQKRIVNDYR